jgi:hypothetical protein
MSEFLKRRKGIGFALLAAVLFGASRPLAKAVSPHVDAVLMAGLLYLGSGLGLGAYAWLRGRRQDVASEEAPLTRCGIEDALVADHTTGNRRQL